MAEITINGVKFTNLPNKRIGVKLGNIISQSNFSGNIEEYLVSPDFYKILCALDIDWNGIEVAENVVINDTADLINWIKSLEGQAGATGDTGAQGEAGPKGDTGATGADGKSAYELYKENVIEKEAQPAIYSFESFNNAVKEVKYGEGTVKVIEMRAGGATVEVVTNSTDQSFVGQQFNIAAALATNDPIQLYTLENEPVDIWVTVELVSEAQEAVVAMTQAEWLASLKGDTGTAGVAGAQGIQGPQGAQGIQGLKGDTGAQGPKGDTGAQGPKGDTGTFDASALEDYATKDFVTDKIAEVVGNAPEQYDTLKEIADAIADGEFIGVKGETGDKGPDGDKGATGDQGEKGETGDKGATGNKGETGDQGPQGPTGDKGPDGDKGATGDQGAVGPTGAEGPQGPTGDKCPTGDTGQIDYSILNQYALKQDVIDNEQVTAAALTDLNGKYEALLARVVTLEGATGTEG